MKLRLGRVLAQGLAAMVLAACSQRQCTVREQSFGTDGNEALTFGESDAAVPADASACEQACTRYIHGAVFCAEPELLSCTGAVAPFVCQVRLTECYTPGDPVCGRRPEGWRDPGSDLADPVAAWWSQLARLEHASVAAFARLADELTAHRAPPALIALARRSRRDEVRHARSMAGFARRAGATMRLTTAPATSTTRPLLAMAEENAVEGCVREAYGAMVAAWQAQHARDPSARAAFARIARDEARHAALAWRVHGWLQSKLSPSQRAQLTAAMNAAVATLAHEHEPEGAATLRDAGLWPDRRALRAGLATLARSLS